MLTPSAPPRWGPLELRRPCVFARNYYVFYAPTPDFRALATIVLLKRPNFSPVTELLRPIRSERRAEPMRISILRGLRNAENPPPARWDSSSSWNAIYPHNDQKVYGGPSFYRAGYPHALCIPMRPRCRRYRRISPDRERGNYAQRELAISASREPISPVPIPRAARIAVASS